MHFSRRSPVTTPSYLNVRSIVNILLKHKKSLFLLFAAAGIGIADLPLPLPLPFALKTTWDLQAQRRRTRKAVQLKVPPANPTHPGSKAALTGDLNHFISRTRNGEWGVMVTSLTRGDTLFSHRANVPMRPASTLKLLSTASALDQRGINYRFTTAVLRDKKVSRDGVLNGDIYIRGEGDPSLSPRFFSGDPNEPLKQLAEQITALGVKRITGNIISDATAFDEHLIPDGWLTRYLGAAYAARVCAISLNDNIVWIAVSPSPSGKGRAIVQLEPASTALTVSHTVRTVPGSGENIKTRKYSDGRIEVSGTIGAKSQTRRYSYVVDNPAMFMAGALETALTDMGIVVEGKITTGKTPPKASVIALLKSPPLVRLVNIVNRESHNLYAELLFRDASRGEAKSVQGSVDQGNATVKRLLKDMGVDITGLSHADGSGLSVKNQITARTMSQFLMNAHDTEWGSALHASLPVSGESESLRRRMNGSAQGNLHAKTGTTDDVVSLAGYVTARNGELLAFTLFYNGTDRWIARESIDAMGETLANLARQ